MAILAFGSSASDFYTGTFDPTMASEVAAELAPYVKEGMKLQYGAHPANTPVYTLDVSGNASDVWVGFTLYMSSQTTNSYELITLIGKGGNSCCAIEFGTSGQMYLKSYREPTSTAKTGDLGKVPSLVATRFDLHLVISGDNTDTVTTTELYMNDVLIGTDTEETDANGETALGQIQFDLLPRSGSNYQVISGVIVSDEDTRGVHVVQHGITANGAQQDWGGDFTDINGIGATVDDTKLLSENVTDSTQTYVVEDLPTLFDTGYDILGAGVVLRANGTGVASPQIVGVTREGTSEQYSSAYQLTGGRVSIPLVLEQAGDSTPWTPALVNSAEFGFKIV